MKKLFFCLLIVNFSEAQGQSIQWYEGSVVLASNEVVTGKVSVEPLLDIILVEHDNARTVYPAHKINSLYFFDETANINRRFISLKNQEVLRTHHELFEIVVQGEVSVLRRQKGRALHPSDAIDFTYFVRYKDNVVDLRKFGKKVYPQLESAMGERLEIFVSANHLQAYNDSNSIRIIEHYNLLLRSDEMSAKH